MITNYEWGAVAYLTNSKYGRCTNGSCTEVTTNNCESYITGIGANSISAVGSSSTCTNATNKYNGTKGVLASTTGNITGVYDMSGGAYENTTGNMSYQSGRYTFFPSSNFSETWYTTSTAKYLTPYAYGESGSDQTAYNRSRLGDATGEVAVGGGLGWHSDFAYFLSSNSNPWFIRGGEIEFGGNNGVFSSGGTDGYASSRVSTRAILVDGQITGFFIRISDDLKELSKENRYFEGIIGTSPAIMEVQRMIRRIANSPSPVLITGETGTGKELIARAIHEQSHRNKYPFVAINCSSIPESLFESELFGYEEGSFTGAKKGGKPGKIEMAQGGTLFLDEIGEMPLFAQPKLLRILQEYELERVGSNKKIHLDIRIIAATNRDLNDMVAEKKFRSDLFYRINVINLKLPSLRTRRDDIIPIAENYIRKLKLKMNTPLTSISPEAAEILLNFDWPGNVRQLQNIIEYAANLCETDILMPSDFPEVMRICSETAVYPSSGGKPAASGSSDKEDRLRELLEKYGYTLEGKKRIAAELNISLRTLYRRIGHLQEQTKK